MPPAAPTYLDQLAKHGTLLLQLGWFLVSCALAWVCSKLWQRVVLLEDWRMEHLAQDVAEAVKREERQEQNYGRLADQLAAELRQGREQLANIEWVEEEARGE